MTEPTKPTSVVERPISQEDRRIAAENEAIRDGVGLLTLAWANVENIMVQILAAIIGDEPHQIASAIYFAPFGIEARLTIVDAAFKALAVPASLRKPLLIEWGAEMNCLNHLKRTRNKAAHGELILYSIRDKPRWRLTAPLYKFDDDVIESVLDGQWPGMGSNELHQSQQAVEQAAKRLRTFLEYAQLVRRDDIATLQQKLADAVARNPNRHNPNSRTPSEQKPEQPPCPE